MKELPARLVNLLFHVLSLMVIIYFWHLLLTCDPFNINCPAQTSLPFVARSNIGLMQVPRYLESIKQRSCYSSDMTQTITLANPTLWLQLIFFVYSQHPSVCEYSHSIESSVFLCWTVSNPVSRALQATGWGKEKTPGKVILSAKAFTHLLHEITP